MQDGSSQPLYGGTSQTRRYEPPQEPLLSGNTVPDVESYYTASSMDPLMEQGEHHHQRIKNFPPCKPLVRHSIHTDISPEKRLFVRKAFIGWFFHCFCLSYNFIVLLAALVIGEGSIFGFLYGLAAVLVGPSVSFAVYYLLYRAIRTSSAFFFVLWFTLFFGQLAAQVFFAIGANSYGAAGFMLMVTMFTDSKVVVGVMAAISTFSWIGVFLYSLWLFYLARIEFKMLGGAKAAGKEFAKQGVQTAYENREFVKEVAVESGSAIKQVAMENKETIINFARDHRQEIIPVAVDNRETVTRVAMENQDTIWQNKDVISSVFDEPQKKY